MKKRGSVLILVVWGIMLLSIFAAALGAQAIFSLSLNERLSQQLQGSYIGLGGVQYVLKTLRQDSTLQVDGLNELWANGPAVFAQRNLGDGTFTVSYTSYEDSQAQEFYGVTDEERKININTAPSDVLRRFFQNVAGLDSEQSLALVEAIEDWKDKDKEQRPHGAEDFYYQGLENQYECKDAPFENLEELLLIKGMSIDRYAKLMPYMTVHSSGKININTAGNEVLEALGLSKSGLEGLIIYRLGEDNAVGTADDRIIQSTSFVFSDELYSYMPVEDINKMAGLVSSDLLSVGSENFRVSVSAFSSEARYPIKIECIIARNGKMSYWTER